VAEPLEVQALAAVVAMLQGMTDVRPWGGNYPNQPRVTRDIPVSPAAVGQCPLLVVTLSTTEGSDHGLGEQVEGMVTVGGAIGYKSTFVFDVIGYVQGTSVPADTWCLRLRKDVLETLCARAEAIPGLSQARSLWPVGATEFDAGVLGENLRAFRQSYAIEFDETMTLA
jgi:hypothetical protein